SSHSQQRQASRSPISLRVLMTRGYGSPAAHPTRLDVQVVAGVRAPKAATRSWGVNLRARRPCRGPRHAPARSEPDGCFANGIQTALDIVLSGGPVAHRDPRHAGVMPRRAAHPGRAVREYAAYNLFGALVGAECRANLRELDVVEHGCA